MKYLVLGCNGQLARAFIRRLQSLSLDFEAPDELRADITNSTVIRDVVGSIRPDVILNCAAYNLVDKAENEEHVASLVNAEGPRYVAEAAQKSGARLVHYSSDYVFDGTKESGLYREDDAVQPLNTYGKTKLAGEQHVLRTSADHLVFRLSWVFGEGKQNFIHKLLEWAGRNDILRITCDEFSVPTSTETVVDVTLKALDNGLTGLYHLTNSGYCSRYEWAKLVLREAGINRFIRPVRMDDFSLPAKRPLFSAMDNGRIAGLVNVEIQPWEEAVRMFVRKGNAA